ncbi:hypothetical protein PENANT_c125G11294 [Penicillium antarcticum]|uniref:Uncharacterized protein n=1 Tax=Penicillium antarcticum TaxID=416450 RepID=A0A1V6PI80_9EURO|nr:hypothetical protein PENANT_c125G11294 [Penicillium antarcticum]
MTDQPSRYPHLHFSTGSIQCLHGQHRLKAGEHYLPSIDQWWTVDLYLDDISPDLQTSLVDEYSNERVPSDGEIYLKVRQYRYEANSHFENRWLARLSDNKARRLRGLESHPSVRAAFDSLLGLPSLMIHGMQIGSLPQALAICCDESSLVGHDRAKILKVDPHTVETLQLLAPGVSSKDRTTVKGLVYSGEVFSNFTESERTSIWKRLKRTEGIIPSLYTFFKDLWYLESCANYIKRLIIPSRSFPTIRGATRAAFLSFDPTHTQFLIQTSEAGFRSYSHSQGDPAELGYRQLWLYAMRHYPKLSKKPQKKNPTAKPNCEVLEPMILYEMAVLAKRLGFQSPQIEQLIQQSPDRQIAQDALLRARRLDRYRYNREEIESLINKVTECFLRAVLLDHKLPVQFKQAKKLQRQQQRQQRRHRSSHADRNYGKEIARINSEGSRIGEVVEPASETEFGFVGSRGIISQNEQGLLHMEPAEADELEHGEIIEGDHDFSDDEESEDSHARFGFVPSRPPSPSVGLRYTSTELQVSTVSHDQLSLMQPP